MSKKSFFSILPAQYHRIKMTLGDGKAKREPSVVFATLVSFLFLFLFFFILLSIAGAGKVGLPVPRAAFASSAEMDAAV
jgi:hypothetical protein